jgi:hypothetical protein
MRTLVLFTVIMALALLTGTHAAVGQEVGKATAKLTGDAEVPGPGDPRAAAPSRSHSIPTEAKSVMS